jgi:hypothetical protein
MSRQHEFRSPDFSHHVGASGEITSICMCCLKTVGTSRAKQDLREMEIRHLCWLAQQKERERGEPEI